MNRSVKTNENCAGYQYESTLQMRIRWMVELRHRSNEKSNLTNIQLSLILTFLCISIVTYKAYNSNTWLVHCCVHRCKIGCASFVMLNYGFSMESTRKNSFWFGSLHSTETSFKIVCFFSLLSWTCACTGKFLKTYIYAYALPIVKLISSYIHSFELICVV